MAPEASFVMKRGEGSHNASMIKHKVVFAEASRASSSVESSPKVTSHSGRCIVGTKPAIKSSYVSPMQRAREQKKQREAAAASGIQSKDCDGETSTTSTSLSSDGTPSSSKPARVRPYSGNLVPSSGYVAKVRDSATEAASDSGHLPKFGVWDNENGTTSGPCYTLLFENVAQEKRTGGPVRAHHVNRTAPSPSRSEEDLYSYNPDAIKVRKSRALQLPHTLLCCFVAGS